MLWVVVRFTTHHLPILVLTSEANEALRASPDLDAVVRKPPEMDHLLHRVDQLLDLQRTSVVRGFALESFVQVLETERKTCTLLVEAPPRAGGSRQSGALRGRLWFRDGRLLDAATADLTGKDALFTMLGWSGAVLKLAEGCDASPRFTDSARALLLEYCVAKDHGQVA